MKVLQIIPFIVLNINLSFSQTKIEINTLLVEISNTEKSEKITTTRPAKQIEQFGTSALIVLADFFKDKTTTKVYSDCLERNLTKGEIALIVADRIQGIPYAKLTGVQNCLMEFCENNPNRIEYYFPWIEDKNESFTKAYVEWINSIKRNRRN